MAPPSGRADGVLQLATEGVGVSVHALRVGVDLALADEDEDLAVLARQFIGELEALAGRFQRRLREELGPADHFFVARPFPSPYCASCRRAARRHPAPLAGLARAGDR